MFLTFLLILFMLLVLPGSVYAYIDPGAGSYLIQILIGTFLGGLYLVKTFWGRITTFLRSLFKNRKKVNQ